MSTREPRPDALIIGAPKAGTSALHAALARHPQIYASPVKEPKYYMCARCAAAGLLRSGRRAQPAGVDLAARPTTPALFAAAPADAVRLESTPFYLYSAERPAADRRGAARRQADRRSSATRSTGRTPTGCTCGSTGWSRSRTSSRPGTEDAADRGRLGAVLALPADGPLRRAAGRPASTGSTASGCWCCATGSWSPSRPRPSTGSPGSSAIAEDQIGTVPPDNSRGFVEPGLRTQVLGRVVRAGAGGRQLCPAGGLAAGQQAAARPPCSTAAPASVDRS